jgi:hypothetical protein
MRFTLREGILKNYLNFGCFNVIEWNGMFNRFFLFVLAFSLQVLQYFLQTPMP